MVTICLFAFTMLLEILADFRTVYNVKIIMLLTIAFGFKYFAEKNII